ncbi:MAG: GAF domain-containing protein [Bdellovibrionales bacterium]|jgi:L-methionine (R)-S-oxide reductase|nr:GAF domain-containing protein [Bdellovibrionales bacterium]
MIPSPMYRELQLELSGLLTEDWISNLANFSASLYAVIPDLNWCGFYLVRAATGPSHLKLGPFQGRPACLDIPFDRGVCGKAARTQSTVIVEDVHAFPGHIACDDRSRSEIVIPLLKDGRVIGVLDLDSPSIGRFSSTDAEGLENLVALLMEKTKWPKEI